jgi:hypothetical protein
LHFPHYNQSSASIYRQKSTRLSSPAISCNRIKEEKSSWRFTQKTIKGFCLKFVNLMRSDRVENVECSDTLALSPPEWNLKQKFSFLHYGCSDTASRWSEISSRWEPSGGWW